MWGIKLKLCWLLAQIKLIETEKSGLSDKSASQMLANFKKEASKGGEL